MYVNGHDHTCEGLCVYVSVCTDVSVVIFSPVMLPVLLCDVSSVLSDRLLSFAWLNTGCFWMLVCMCVCVCVCVFLCVCM